MTDNQAPGTDQTMTDQTQGTAVATTDQPWYADIEDQDLRGYAELKGFKDHAAALKSYRELEKFHGVPPEQIIKLPKAGADPKEMDAVWERLGVPKTAEEYKLPVPDGQDPAFANQAAQWMKEANIPVQAGAALAEKWNTFMTQTAQAQEVKYQAEGELAITKLKDQLGADYEPKIEMGRRFVQDVGKLQEADVKAIEKAIGPAKMMQLFVDLGSKLGEDTFHGSGDKGGGFNAMSPAAARVKLKELQSDQEWSRKYIGGGIEQKAEYEKLTRIISAGIG